MMLRLITLDVTNTILRFRKPPGDQYAAVAQLYGLNPDPQKLNESFRSSFKNLDKEVPNFGAGSIGWQNWWLSIVCDTFKGAKCTADETVLTAVGYHLIKHFSTAHAYEVIEGSIPLLERISANTVKVGAISNFDDRLEGLLTRLGVRHYFDFVVSSYNVKLSKPDPRIFQQALEIAGSGITPSEALHIGDDLQRDYLGAKACGWHSWLVSKDYIRECEEEGVVPDPATMFTCLEDVMPLLEKFHKGLN